MGQSDFLSSLMVSDIILWVEILLVTIVVLLLVRLFRKRATAGRRLKSKNFKIVSRRKPRKKKVTPRIYGRVKYDLSESELAHHEEHARKLDKESVYFRFMDRAPALTIDGEFLIKRKLRPLPGGPFAVFESYNEVGRSSAPDHLILISEKSAEKQFPVIHIDHHHKGVSRVKYLKLIMDGHVLFKRKKYAVGVTIEYDY